MYQGYLAIGGRDGVGTTEIINALRTHAYASHLVPSLNLLLPPSYEAPDLPELLGHSEYGTPISDQPVWVDGDVPASYEFLGLYPKEIVGLDESTWHADTEEYVQDGGVPLRGRNEGREILVKGLMVATTDAGMDAGMAWLRNVLSDTECREAGECGGERMIVMASPPKVCPEAMGEEVNPNAVHPCLVPYVRQYYRVQAIEGVKVLRRMETDCGPLVEVEFMLYAGVPQPHRLPEFIGMAQGDPVATYENLITNPSFENGLDTVTASPSAILSRDDSWSSAGDYSLRMQATREPPRVRHNYVLNPSLEADDSGWEAYDLATNTGTRVSDRAAFGTHSFRVDTTVATSTVGATVPLAPSSGVQKAVAFYLDLPDPPPGATQIGAQVMTRGADGVALALRGGLYPISSGWTRAAFALTPQADPSDVPATLLMAAWFVDEAGEAIELPAGYSAWFDAALLEDSTLAGTYFDGDTPDEPGITYAWEPDGGSSATYEGVISSTITYADLTDGSPLPYDINPGSTYHLQAVLRMTSASAQNRPLDARTIQVVWTTLSGSELAVRSSPAPNLPGEHEVSLDFDVPDNVTHGVIRLYGGTSADTWWDSVLLSEQTPPHYFDGSSVDEDGWVYAWEGAAHASASLAEYNPAPPETIPEITCDAPEQTIVLRRNLYPNPGPTVPDGWQSLDTRGSFSARFVPDNSLRAGGQSLEVERLRGNRSIYMAFINRLGYRQFASSRPRATAGHRYTASVWVKTDRVGKARMRAVAFDASNTSIAEWRSAIPDLPANTWTRLSVTFTAPQGTTNIGSDAWTYVNSSTMAPTGALSWFAHALLERTSSLNDYFDGNFSDTPEFDYAWEGVPGYSESIITDEETGDLLVDPDCPYIPPPPAPPEIPTACIETPDEWTRFTVLVASEHVPRWGSAMPVVSLYSGSAAARQIRIRFYPVADPDDPQIYNECSYDIEFILTYLPPNSEMIIDGVTRSADVSVGGGQQMSALHLLTGSGGEPYTWGSLTCDRTYLMTVDVAPLSPDASVSLSLVGRE